MTRFAASSLIWLGWLALFGILEALAIWGQVPWEPLSDWVWRLERLDPFVAWVVLVGLAVLLVHLVARWP
jgi:hypothetical protein